MSNDLRAGLRALVNEMNTFSDWPAQVREARGRRHRRRVGLAAAASLLVIPAAVLIAVSVGSEPDRLVTASPSTQGGTGPAIACPKTAQPEHLSPDQQEVTEAYICASDYRTIPTDGIREVTVVRRVTDGLETLLQAYEEPDESGSADTNCITSLRDPLTVYLHDSGSVHAVRAPKDACGSPSARAANAYNALGTVIVWEEKGRQAKSQQAVDSGCLDASKDSLALEEQTGASTAARARPEMLSGPVSVCKYAIETNAQGDRIGRLEGTRKLTTSQIEEINQALSRVVADGTCSRRQQSHFALLMPASGPVTVVALDGCAVSQSSQNWWRAPDDLRRLLQ